MSRASEIMKNFKKHPVIKKHILNNMPHVVAKEKNYAPDSVMNLRPVISYNPLPWNKLDAELSTEFDRLLIELTKPCVTIGSPQINSIREEIFWQQKIEQMIKNSGRSLPAGCKIVFSSGEYKHV